MDDFRKVMTAENVTSLVPEVLSALSSDSWSDRNKGCKAVPSIVQLAPSTALAFIGKISRALTDTHPGVRYSACESVPALVSVAPDQASAFVMGLRKLVADPDTDVAEAARDVRSKVIQMAPVLRDAFGPIAMRSNSKTHPATTASLHLL